MSLQPPPPLSIPEAAFGAAEAATAGASGSAGNAAAADSGDFDALFIARTFALFAATALMELMGCYLPYLVLNKGASPWLWLPTAGALALFVYLLTLHPDASGRVYASYGGIYVLSAIAWLRVIDKAELTRWDMFGAAVTFAGAAIIVLQPKSHQ